MKLLAIETSSAAGSVAVVEWAGGDGRRSEIDFPQGTRHGKALVPSIGTLLEEVDWAPEGIDAVAVSIGPGSYMGLRIGLVCAKMISALAEAHLVAVPTLDVIAHNVSRDREYVCAVIDARRHEVYAAQYERQGTSLSRRSGYAVVMPEELVQLNPGTCLVGDGIPVVESSLNKTSRKFYNAPKEQWVPRARIVAEIGLGLYMEGVRHDPYATEPMYLRRPAAEEKWAQREPACG